LALQQRVSFILVYKNFQQKQMIKDGGMDNEL
jgi:hypothetical protein